MHQGAGQRVPKPDGPAAGVPVTVGDEEETQAMLGKEPQLAAESEHGATVMDDAPPIPQDLPEAPGKAGKLGMLPELGLLDARGDRGAQEASRLVGAIAESGDQEAAHVPRRGVDGRRRSRHVRLVALRHVSTILEAVPRRQILPELVGRLDERAFHPKRFEHTLLKVARIAHARDLLHQVTGQCDAVGVVRGDDAGRPDP